MATTFDVFYLGVVQDIDPTDGIDGDNVAEDAAVLVGMTFGGVGDALANHIVSWAIGSTGVDGGGKGKYDQDNVPAETFTINGGPDQTFDSAVSYSATITYTNGTTAVASVIIGQDTVGNLYLIPQKIWGIDQEALEVAPIRSLTLDSLIQNSYSGLSADRYDGTYMTLPAVDGTSGADAMSLGYTDADGDAITTGADTVSAGDGNDTVNGDAGNDVIDAGAGDDLISGGAGDDTFIYDPLQPGAGNDTISDFNFGNTGTLTDGDSTNNDFVDLSGYYDNLQELYADIADDGVLNQSNALDGKGRTVDYSDNTLFGTGSLTFTGATADATFFTVENTGVTCFAEGMCLGTPDGEVPVEALRPGDLVETADHGPQPILWIGSSHIGKQALALAPKLRPVRIKAGALGNSVPLLVSPQHCMVMRSQDGREGLVRAIHLTLTPLARIARGCKSVRYFHLLLARHEILFCHGAATESFYPGLIALTLLDSVARAQVIRMFPALNRHPTEQAYGPRARPTLSKQETLAACAPRHLNRQTPSQSREQNPSVRPSKWPIVRD